MTNQKKKSQNTKDMKIDLGDLVIREGGYQPRRKISDQKLPKKKKETDN
jgi:hypothetical protein